MEWGRGCAGGPEGMLEGGGHGGPGLRERGGYPGTRAGGGGGGVSKNGGEGPGNPSRRHEVPKAEADVACREGPVKGSRLLPKEKEVSPKQSRGLRGGRESNPSRCVSARERPLCFR